MLGALMTCRQQCIESMMDHVHQVVDKYDKADSSNLECKNTPPQEECDSLVLGLLLRTFKRKQVYPVASSVVMHKSIRQIKEILDDITFPIQVWCTSQEVLATGYCGNCSTTRQGWLVSPDGYCSTCRTYNLRMPGPSHTNACSPVSAFKNSIQAIYDKVVGLDGECFVRANKERGGEDLSMPKAGQSLWDFFEYV